MRIYANGVADASGDFDLADLYGGKDWERDSAGHDRPLTSHWHLADPSIFDYLGLPRVRKAMALARAEIITEAFIIGRADLEDWISYSRRKAWYATKHRYWTEHYTYQNIVSSVDQLAAAGLVENRKMPPGNLGWQSHFRATPELTKRLSAKPLSVIHDPREGIILRDMEGNLLDYSDTVRTRQMRRSLDEINEAILATTIELEGHGTIESGDPLQLGGRNMGVAHNDLCRVFNRGSFGLGGRFYNSLQNIPKKLREHITLNGRPTTEPDYRYLHPTLLYAEAGKTMHGDPYEIAGWDRPLAKVGFNTLVNAGTRLAAIRSIAKGMKVEGAFDKAKGLVEEIEKKHPEIAHTFGTLAGLRLMRTDSDLAEGVMLDCRKKGVVVLPVHDSFLVPQAHQGVLREAMETALARTLRRIGRAAVAVTGSAIAVPPEQTNFVTRNPCAATESLEMVPHYIAPAETTEILGSAKNDLPEQTKFVARNPCAATESLEKVPQYGTSFLSPGTSPSQPAGPLLPSVPAEPELASFLADRIAPEETPSTHPSLADDPAESDSPPIPAWLASEAWQAMLGLMHPEARDILLRADAPPPMLVQYFFQRAAPLPLANESVTAFLALSLSNRIRHWGHDFLYRQLPKGTVLAAPATMRPREPLADWLARPRRDRPTIAPPAIPVSPRPPAAHAADGSNVINLADVRRKQGESL